MFWINSAYWITIKIHSYQTKETDFQILPFWLSTKLMTGLAEAAATDVTTLLWWCVAVTWSDLNTWITESTWWFLVRRSDLLEAGWWCCCCDTCCSCSATCCSCCWSCCSSSWSRLDSLTYTWRGPYKKVTKRTYLEFYPKLELAAMTFIFHKFSFPSWGWVSPVNPTMVIYLLSLPGIEPGDLLHARWSAWAMWNKWEWIPKINYLWKYLTYIANFSFRAPVLIWTPQWVEVRFQHGLCIYCRLSERGEFLNFIHTHVTHCFWKGVLF